MTALARILKYALPAILIAPGPTVGQDISFGGQVRPRTEVRDNGSSSTDAFVSMRIRAYLRAALEDDVVVFIELQDVRLWGEESSTLGDFRADNFDLHQGYLEVARKGSTSLAARVGRQEVTFGGERLVGPVGWTQQGRSFDGVRLSADGPSARVDVLGAVLADATAATADENAYLLAAYAQVRRVGPGTLDSYGLYHRVESDDGTGQVTLGARWSGEEGPYAFRAEGSFQAGERSGSDVSAFMLGARVGRELAGGRAKITAWYDYLSGDDDPTDGEIRVFDTLFATNHKFYGFADFFLNIPIDTANRGLQDLAVKGRVTPAQDVTIGLDIHSFRLAKSEGLASGHLGEETDVTLTYRYSRQLSFVAGLSHFFSADGFAEIGRLTSDATWLYMMADARF